MQRPAAALKRAAAKTRIAKKSTEAIEAEGGAGDDVKLEQAEEEEEGACASDEEDQEDGDPEEEAEPLMRKPCKKEVKLEPGQSNFCRLRLRKGHDDEMTIIAYKSSLDEVQICSATLAQCELRPGNNPLAVAKKIQIDVPKQLKLFVGPVKGSEIADQLRVLVSIYEEQACIAPLEQEENKKEKERERQIEREPTINSSNIFV